MIDPFTNVIEHPEVVADRMARAAERSEIPRSVLAANRLRLRHVGRMGPGLAPTWSGPSSARLRDGARIASTRLF